MAGNGVNWLDIKAQPQSHKLNQFDLKWIYTAYTHETTHSKPINLNLP